MLRILELLARLQEELRHTPGIGYDMAQRIAQADDTQFQEELVAAARAGEGTPSIRARIAHFRSQQDSTTSRKKSRTSSMIQLSHREGNCTATLRGKREPGAMEYMLEALRQLADQVRGDDSLR